MWDGCRTIGLEGGHGVGGGVRYRNGDQGQLGAICVQVDLGGGYWIGGYWIGVIGSVSRVGVG